MTMPVDMQPQLDLVGGGLHVFEREFLVEGDRLVHELRLDDVVHRSSIPFQDSNTDDLLGSWWRGYLRGERPSATPKEAPPVRFAELFSGPGGLALGLTQACAELGLEAVSAAAADQDAEAMAVYRRRNGTRLTSTESVSMLIDHEVDGQGVAADFLYEPEIVDEEWAELVGRVDVLLAGPPCQGHSNLNNKTRRNDWRNELYLTAPAMAIALQAPVVIIENVRAVLHDTRQVVQSSRTLLEAAGYTVDGEVLKAASMGWAQTRERYFLVARKGVAPVSLQTVAAALHAEPHSIWWAISDLEYPGEGDYMSRPPEFSEENKRRIAYLHDNDLYNLPLSERPDCHKDGTTYNAVYGRLHQDLPAPTITTGFMTPGRGRYIHPTQKRVITAREAARLQGFPDTYDFRPHSTEQPAKSKLAKWIGDAVPMPLGYAASLAALLPELA